jgi:hypothetical protein
VYNSYRSFSNKAICFRCIDRIFKFLSSIYLQLHRCFCQLPTWQNVKCVMPLSQYTTTAHRCKQTFIWNFESFKNTDISETYIVTSWLQMLHFFYSHIYLYLLPTEVLLNNDKYKRHKASKCNSVTYLTHTHIYIYIYIYVSFRLEVFCKQITNVKNVTVYN